ncbi:MAG: ester cyclase [Abitibacteriaceae bacterium]|nr:ester cyclase [Abditibacteriaceae bacterium]
MSAQENKAHILRFTEQVLNNHNLAACDDLVAPDFVELDPFPGQEQGREGLKGVLAQMRSAFPDIHWSIEEQIAEADKVVTRFVWRGTHQGEFFGVPATGQQVAVPGVVIDRIVEGKMQDSRILMDTLSLMQQLGAVPPPGQPGS